MRKRQGQSRGAGMTALRRRVLLALCLSLAAVLVAFAPGAGAGSGADGTTYVLTDFDGTSLLGLNDQGRTFTAQLGASTTFRQAQLDKYRPTDPYQVACREAAASYNDALVVQSSDGLTSAIAALVSGGCKARVVLTPQDPYLPPSPIRIRSFQPVSCVTGSAAGHTGRPSTLRVLPA